MKLKKHSTVKTYTIGEVDHPEKKPYDHTFREDKTPLKPGKLAKHPTVRATIVAIDEKEDVLHKD